jgi:hypothetical protein
MTTNENSGSVQTGRVKTGWFRRVVMGTAFAAVGLLTFGAVSTPAQAYWYHYGYPYYTSYYTPYYGYYGPAYYGPGYYGWGWGWHRGWHRW